MSVPIIKISSEKMGVPQPAVECTIKDLKKEIAKNMQEIDAINARLVSFRAALLQKKVSLETRNVELNNWIQEALALGVLEGVKK